MTGILLGDLCRSVMQTGLVLLLQTGLLLLLGLGAAWALRRRGAQAQSFACRATLLAVLLVALLSPTLVHGRRALWRISFLSAAPVPLAAPTVTDTVPTSEPAAKEVRALPVPRAHVFRNTGRVEAPPMLSARPPVPASRFYAAQALCFLAAGLWLAGTVALLAWLGLGQASLMILQRRSAAVEGEARALLTHLCAARGLAAPGLVMSPRVAGPFLAGLWRPAVFLPTTYAQDFDGGALRAVLAHELGHLERRDNAWMLLGRLTCALLWPQPLLWALSRRMAQASEEACDALALAQGCSPRAYADCLLSLAARRSFSLGERAVGVGIVSFRSSVGRRIQTVLAAKGKAMPALSSHLRAAVLAGAVAAALAAACLVSSSAPAQPAVASAQPAVASIVGTWRGTVQHKIDTITFRTDGTVTDVEEGVRTDGTYQVTGDSLVVIIQTEGGKRQPITSTPTQGLHVQVKGDTLTLFDKNGQQGVVFSRIADSVPEASPAVPAAPAQTADAPIVGTWRGENPEHQVGTVTFRSDGTTTAAGTDFREDGTYHVTGNSLTVTTTHSQLNDGRLANTPPPTRLHFKVSGNTLTLIRNNGQRATLTRITDALSEAAPPPTPAAVGPSTEADLLAGLTPVQGPGLIVTLRDSKKPLPAFPKAVSPPNLIHDTDINQVVNELKAAGAEAIAVNDQRLVGMSPIRCAGPTVYVNNTPQAPPFVIKAIGDAKTMQDALNLPNGVADQLQRLDPTMISLQPSPSLTLPAYSGTAQPRFAHVVGQATAHGGQ